MKTIQLTQGFVTTVDDEDYKRLALYNWYVQNYRNLLYAATTIRGKTYPMHRFIMKVSGNKILVDHRDRNGLNNQKNNLRLCSTSQNSANRRVSKKLHSNYLGVTKCNGSWCAGSRKDGKYFRKYYKTEIEAAMGYNELATINHGEFANLNVI
jgi:hypothetical protein